MRVLAAALGLGVIVAAGPALAGDPERAALFIGAMRDNGCAMTEDQAAEMMPALGFEQDETRVFVEVLYTATLVGFSEDWNELSLARELCEGAPDQDAAVYAGALADFEAMADEFVPITDEELVAILADELGPDFLRSAAAFVASEAGCVIDVSDREAAAAELYGFVESYLTQVYGLTGPVGPATEAEARVLVAGFLAEPGPEFTLQDGQLTLADCTPIAD